MKKKALSLMLTLTMLLSLVPAFSVGASADAATEDTTATVGNYTIVVPKGADIPNTDSGTSVTTVTSSTTTWGDTWYVVTDNNLTIDSTVTVSGDVNLILADGCSLTVNGSADYAGILVSGDNSLTVYAQSTGSKMGSLSATGGQSGAGIGGGNCSDGSNITINGGTVTATGGTDGAGIGGGNTGSGSNITINGGEVTATSGSGGAGIGGGGVGGSGSYITINGGTVTANGDSGGAGIGGGINGSGSYITISGGTVTANGGTNAAGVGSGDGCEESASDITIAAGLIVKADNNTIESKDLDDTFHVLASSAKRYVTIIPPTQVCAVGSVNGTKYTSIAGALAAAHTDENAATPTVIYLIADDTENVTIESERYITLDLNGHLLSGDKTTSVITNNGTLTIADSDPSVTRYFTSSNNNGKCYDIAIIPTAILTMAHWCSTMAWKSASMSVIIPF